MGSRREPDMGKPPAGGRGLRGKSADAAAGLPVVTPVSSGRLRGGGTLGGHGLAGHRRGEQLGGHGPHGVDQRQRGVAGSPPQAPPRREGTGYAGRPGGGG